MIKLGQYKVCVLDLITDAKNGRLSNMAIWDIIGKIVMTKILLDQKDVSVDLFVAYGGIVCGSHVATLFLKWKYRDAPIAPPVAPKEPDRMGAE